MSHSEIVTREEIRAFTMPDVAIGTPVLWRAVKGREPEIAFVFRKGNRNVHLATATRGIKESVRHEKDPKLKLNSEQREMGAWDFTDWHKQQMAKEEILLERINRLEQLVNTLASSGGIKDESKLAGPREDKPVDPKFEELKDRCRILGIPLGPGRPTIEKMQAAIDEAAKAANMTRSMMISEAKARGVKNAHSMTSEDLRAWLKEQGA